MSKSVSIIVTRVWVAEVTVWGVVVNIAMVVCAVVSVMTPSVFRSVGSSLVIAP